MIDKDTLVTNILNGQTKEQYTSLLIFAFIGLLISICAQLIRARKRIKTKGGFSLKVWINENYLRAIMSILVIIVGVLYSPEIGGYIGVDLQVNNFGALITGAITDVLVDVIVNLDIKARVQSILSKFTTK